MVADLFPTLDGILAGADPGRGLDYVIDQLRSQKAYALLFEALLMKKRFELGLPLIQTESSAEFAPQARVAYDQAMLEAARETGHLFLGEGEIERAWPYFRAIGESDPVAAAIEAVEPREEMDSLINIAVQEGVNPAKGLQLMLSRHGMCRAITCFGMYPIQKDRERCIALLVRSLHTEIVERMGRAIESVDASRPDDRTLSAMMAGRPWLFGEYDYYVDTSHLTSLLQYCPEVTDPAVLNIFRELCDYGRHLSHNFQTQGAAPFENPFVDYDHYAQALLGMEVHRHIAHFRDKLAALPPEEAAYGPAQILVNLLVRLERYQDALSVSLEYLAEAPVEIPCPTASQLCFLAKDYQRLRSLARDRGDLLTYLAASALAR